MMRSVSKLLQEKRSNEKVGVKMTTNEGRAGAEDACLFQTATGVRKSTCVQVINFHSFVFGAMASSSVSSVLNIRDAAGNNAEMRTGAYIKKIYDGDAARFHE